MTITTTEKNAKKKGEYRFTKRENSFRIWGFMLMDLGLRKCELMVYAVIFNLYHNLGAEYRGSNRYLCERTGYERTQVHKALVNLTNKGYLSVEFEKTPYGLSPVFSINPRSLPECEMFNFENYSVKVADEIDRRKAEGLKGAELYDSLLSKDL